MFSYYDIRTLVVHLVGYVGRVVSAKRFENADTATRRRHVGDMSGRHVGDMVVVVALFDATPSAPCRHAHDMPTTCTRHVKSG